MMNRIILLLSLCVVYIGICLCSSCEEKFCNPLQGDLAIGRILQVIGSCESSQLCSSQDTYLNDRNSNTRWVSEPGQQNATIQLDLETSFKFQGVNITFATFLPAAAVLEASIDWGASWRTLQFYATDCPWYFNVRDQSAGDRADITDVICTPDYSGVHQLGGSLLFQLILPQHLPFWATDPAQLSLPASELTITNLRLRLLALQPVNSLVAISYSISSFEVYGACHCYGHASTCLPVEGHEAALVPGLCECRHSTEGEHCERCLYGYNRRTWVPSTPAYPGFCERCSCYSHSDSCYYDRDRERQFCEECQHNTTGDLCEECATGFFQNPVYKRRGWLFHPKICRDCKCDTRGATHVQCDHYGFCQCKENVRGAECDRCKPGFYGLEASEPDGCKPCVCGPGAKGCDPVTGKCLCKKYATGLLCQTCNNGYYGPFPGDIFGCRLCGCSVGTTVQPRICHPGDGTCICREGVEGESCSQVRDGYYVEQVSQGDVDTRVSPLCLGGDRVACDLAGIWSDETSQSKRCEEDLASDTCCSYSQKLISIFLNNGAVPCACHINGTQSDTCDKCGGQCECRDFTAGRDCSECTQLEGVCGMCPRASPVIGDCLSCFCNGFSQECSVARDWRRQLISLDTESQDWVGQTAGQVVDGYNPFLERTQEHILYRLTASESDLTIAYPPNYLGDRRNAYSSELLLGFTSNFIPDSLQIVISSVHGSSQLISEIRDLSQLNALRIDLREDQFVRSDSGQAATEIELRSSLVRLDSLQLVFSAVSSTGRGDRYIRLFGADLWHSVPNENGGELASNVEECACPVERTGQFCEGCASGYTRAPESGGQFAVCAACSCSGHSATCGPEDGACRDCQQNTEGKYCHQCQEGFYGDPSSPMGCYPCQCPTGPTSPFQVSNSCVAIDTSQPLAGHICECPANYSGPNCQGCTDGYRGDPPNGAPCERCDVCYDQYLSLTAVVPAEIQALEAFVQSCVGWESGFDFFDKLQANITQLKQLISQAKLSDATLVCQLADSLRNARGFINETSLLLASIPAINPSLSLRETQNLIQAITIHTSLFSQTQLINFIDPVLSSIIQFVALFDQLSSLLNASNAFYSAARDLRVSLSSGDIAITRSIELYLTINSTEVPGQIETIEEHRNAVTEVSLVARASLCGQSTQCLDGTYQRLVVVANLFQSHIRDLEDREDNLLAPLSALIANRSVFEDLLGRLVALRDILIPINMSLCQLVPALESSIDSVNLCIQQSADASELSRVSTEILQLSISLSVSEVTEIVLYINRTLEQVLTNEQILNSGHSKLQLVQPFLDSLIYNQLLLNESFARLLALSPGLSADSISVSAQLTQLEQLRENVRNLSVSVQRIISDLGGIASVLPSLTERVDNASMKLEDSLWLRESNQEILSDITQRGRDTADAIDTLIDRSNSLIPQGSLLAQTIQEISATINDRFRLLNDSYPRIEALRIKLNAQVIKVNELRDFANNILTRQTALEALLEKTETHLDTHVLSGQLQEIDATGKCLNYIGEI